MEALRPSDPTALIIPCQSFPNGVVAGPKIQSLIQRNVPHHVLTSASAALYVTETTKGWSGYTTDLLIPRSGAPSLVGEPQVVTIACHAPQFLVMQGKRIYRLPVLPQGQDNTLIDRLNHEPRECVVNWVPHTATGSGIQLPACPPYPKPSVLVSTDAFGVFVGREAVFNDDGDVQGVRTRIAYLRVRMFNKDLLVEIARHESVNEALVLPPVPAPPQVASAKTWRAVAERTVADAVSRCPPIPSKTQIWWKWFLTHLEAEQQNEARGNASFLTLLPKRNLELALKRINTPWKLAALVERYADETYDDSHGVATRMRRAFSFVNALPVTEERRKTLLTWMHDYVIPADTEWNVPLRRTSHRRAS